MSILSYKTKNNASAYGIPKVYFCCHSKDLNAFFDDIVNEIFSKQNCSVWYHGEDIPEYTNEFFEDLQQMNLFVVPITERFLSKNNPALEVEFRFAVEHHIPILPLMQEGGLDKKFNELCGNIQYLDKRNPDSTCIEYDDKLEKFLASVLVGDELAQKIRDSFVGNIFLSYRKKDRSYAQSLMKLIHKYDFCRDVAIWYDEFLVPGENFNSAIQDALHKSDLFVLTVTPNLVNETNYIMNVEFPMAKEENKPILPCEMAQTNKVLLAEKYKNIPECTSGYDNVGLADALRNHLRGIISENKSTPEHLFYIGMAYLNGIDVEVDRERALELITSAAEQDFPNAINQLITMYTNGDGVKSSRGKALYWRKRLLDVTKKIYEQNSCFSTAYNHIRAYYELANLCYEADLLEEAIDYSNRLKAFCSAIIGKLDCSREERLNIKRMLPLADMLLGQVCHANSDFTAAKKHFDTALVLLDELNKKLIDPHVLRDTSLLYNKMALLFKVRGEYDMALDYYEKALHIQKHNSQSFGGEELHLVDQVQTLLNIGEICRIKGDATRSREHCLTAINVLDGIIRIFGIKKYIGLKMVTLMALSESYRLECNYISALDVYVDLMELEEIYIKQFGEEPAYTRGVRLMKTAQIHLQLFNTEAAIKYGEQALEYYENKNIISREHIATDGDDYAAIYLMLGVAYYIGRNDTESSLKYLKKGVDLSEDYISRGVICNLPDLVLAYATYGDVLQMNGDLEGAGESFKKATDLYEKYLRGEPSFRNLCAAFTIYSGRGKNYVAKAMYNEAIETLNKALSLHSDIIRFSPASEATLKRDYAIVCFQLSRCYYVDDAFEPAKEYCLKFFEAYDDILESSYLLSDWDMIGLALYQMYDMSPEDSSEQEIWEDNLFGAAHKLKKMYPSLYKETLFYEALEETGVFD